MIDTLRQSGLVDPDWYLSHYPDVRGSGMDPVEHYVLHGAKEGRNPGPGFNTIWYVSENPECFVEDRNPLLHYLEEGASAGLSPLPLDEAQAFESFLRTCRAGRLSGTRFHDHIDGVLVQMLPPQNVSDHALPLPPLELSLRVGSPTLDEFERIGRTIKDAIKRCLPQGFMFENARCLDFGCGVGRIIRHFSEEAEFAEFWGCDIDGTSIRWNVENMGARFRFFQLGDTPALPLEENSFDLIYAIGVFSQIYDGWHQWAMELRRVLKPGGVLIISFAGQIPFEEMMSRSYSQFCATSGMYVRNPFLAWNKGGPTVFMSPQWIESMWGNMFDIDFIALNGLLDYHSLCLLRKPQFGRRRQNHVPVVALGNAYRFDPDATARIFSDYDPRLPYLESFGLQGHGTISVNGWVVFRGDEPVSLTTEVGDVQVPSECRFTERALYNDWDSVQYSFAAKVDVSTVGAGQHQLAAVFRSSKGHVHCVTVPLKVV